MRWYECKLFAIDNRSNTTAEYHSKHKAEDISIHTAEQI
jgi:hypothetical protein